MTTNLRNIPPTHTSLISSTFLRFNFLSPLIFPLSLNISGVCCRCFRVIGIWTTKSISNHFPNFLFLSSKPVVWLTGKFVLFDQIKTQIIYQTKPRLPMLRTVTQYYTETRFSINANQCAKALRSLNYAHTYLR